jgi:Putative peptidoglycan binding domain
MARLEDALTPVTPGEVYAALQLAWRRQFDTSAHRTSLLVLLAQWALETGRGHSMHCFNLGNVKSNAQSGDWCFFRCNEIIVGKVVWFDPDDPGCRFRAFTSLDDGALDYLKTLHQRFQRAWPAVIAGDPVAFSHLLRTQNYYTADETQYTKTLVALFVEFSRTIAAPSPSDPENPLPDLYTTIGLQTALAALGFDPGVVDGVDGPNTTAAVRHFQASAGLLPDGIVGRITRRALAEAWATSRR